MRSHRWIRFSEYLAGTGYRKSWWITSSAFGRLLRASCSYAVDVTFHRAHSGGIVNITRRRFLQLAGGAAAISAIPQFAFALDYPTRPVHLIVGFPPGGSADIVTRLLAQAMTERLGQSFIVDNRSGAGSNLGTE